MTTFHVGQIAPDFSLPDQDGKIHSLADYRGKWVLLYFYPEDDTPGCTVEACSLRDNLPHFQNINAIILGVSVNRVASHKKFADKYDLPFTLLADENKETVNRYGVWQEKIMFGRKFIGTVRSSFLIDPHGGIKKIYQKVKPKEHAEQVLKDLKQVETSKNKESI